MRRFLMVGVLMLALGGNASATVLGAVERGDHLGLEQALAMGSSVEEKNAQGQTALLVAVWKNDIDVARLLLAAGADVNAKDGIHDSPFLVAGVQGRVDILRGGTALIPAAEKGHPDAVDLLIAAGVNVDHVNRLGWTALLEVAILTDGGPTSQRIVRSLLQAGADVDINDSDGKDALAHARARGPVGNSHVA